MPNGTRMQTITALLLLMTGLSALQASGVLTSFVAADSTPSPNQTVSQAMQTEIMQAISNTVTVVLQVQPSSNAITAGEFAKFGIQIIVNSTADVFLDARGVPPNSVAIFTPNVGVANPGFNSSLTIVTSADTPPGNYNVTTVAIINGKESTRPLDLQILATSSVTGTYTTMNVPFGTTLAMIVGTDQPQYQPDSTINIQGQVTDATGSAVSDATVSIQVDAPTGAELFYSNSIHTNPAGTFQAQVSLTPSSPSGTYTVFASATKLGYSSVTTRTTFVVGATTTPSVVIKAVYAGDNSGKPTSTFTKDQTIWIWIVIQNIGSAFKGYVWIQVRDPNGVPVQIQVHFVQLNAGETIKDGLGFTLLGNPTLGVYTVNALVSDKLISQGGTFLASSEAQFAVIG